MEQLAVVCTGTSLRVRGAGGVRLGPGLQVGVIPARAGSRLLEQGFYASGGLVLSAFSESGDRPKRARSATLGARHTGSRSGWRWEVLAGGIAGACRSCARPRLPLPRRERFHRLVSDEERGADACSDGGRDLAFGAVLGLLPSAAWSYFEHRQPQDAGARPAGRGRLRLDRLQRHRRLPRLAVAASMRGDRQRGVAGRGRRHAVAVPGLVLGTRTAETQQADAAERPVPAAPTARRPCAGRRGRDGSMAYGASVGGGLFRGAAPPPVIGKTFPLP